MLAATVLEEEWADIEQDEIFLQLFTGNMYLVLENHTSYSYCDLVGQYSDDPKSAWWC